MKKDRNSFFSDYGFSSGNPPMNPNMMMPGGMQGQIGGYPSPTPMPLPSVPPIPTDIDSRISKLERQINRLETRVSKLEGDSYQPGTPPNENEYNYNNSMYMV